MMKHSGDVLVDAQKYRCDLCGEHADHAGRRYYVDMWELCADCLAWLDAMDFPTVMYQPNTPLPMRQIMWRPDK